MANVAVISAESRWTPGIFFATRAQTNPAAGAKTSGVSRTTTRLGGKVSCSLSTPLLAAIALYDRRIVVGDAGVGSCGMAKRDHWIEVAKVSQFADRDLKQ